MNTDLLSGHGGLSRKWVQQPLRDRDLSPLVCSVNNSYVSTVAIGKTKPLVLFVGPLVPLFGIFR